VHADVSSTAKHMMVSKVRGHFRTFSGTLVTSEDITQSSVIAEIDMASFSTNNDQRHDRIRSKDFFDVENYPTMTFPIHRRQGQHSAGDRSRAGSTAPLSNRPFRRLGRMPFEGRWTHTLGTAAPRLGAPSVG